MLIDRFELMNLVICGHDYQVLMHVPTLGTSAAAGAAGAV
jgi:hypothetical protein